MKNIVIRGISGSMGIETARMIIEHPEYRLAAGMVDKSENLDLTRLTGLAEAAEVEIFTELAEVVEETNPDILVDFTSPKNLLEAMITALELGLDLVIGTTGLSDAEVTRLKEAAEASEQTVMLIPNFSLGAVLMMKFAQQASKYFPRAEIIEGHHEDKVDAPSGTSLATAEMLADTDPFLKEEEIKYTIAGVRGGEKNNVRIHSLRLPGLMARQEVIFGGQGQTFTLTHNTIARSSYMPGVKLALDKLDERSGFIYGLDKLLEQ